MENYFMSREELAQFIDRLVAKKPLKVADKREATEKRETLMSDLDHSIRLSILGKLSGAQLGELENLLDRDLADTADSDRDLEDAYVKFFQNAGVDLRQTISNAATEFAQAYLGGANV